MNERQWYYAVGQQQHGPVPATELIEFFRRVFLEPDIPRAVDYLYAKIQR
jgi:hypothetical protein